MSFVLLKQLVASDIQRKEMMEAKGLQAACRAVKSDKPEVSADSNTVHAQQLLCTTTID